MRFGEYLVSRKLVTDEQLSKALELQRASMRPMGKFAKKLGYISRKDNVRVLLEHIKGNKRYGDLAVEMGFLTEEQVRDVLETQSREGVMLGKILVQEGALTRVELLHALKDFTPLVFKVNK